MVRTVCDVSSSLAQAWTATDHTCYTLTTAGHEGALNLFPIYADHILYPCLTDASFTTEVRLEQSFTVRPQTYLKGALCA